MNTTQRSNSVQDFFLTVESQFIDIRTRFVKLGCNSFIMKCHLNGSDLLEDF